MTVCAPINILAQMHALRYALCVHGCMHIVWHVHGMLYVPACCLVKAVDGVGACHVSVPDV